MLKVGDKAPDFTLIADDGESISLSDFKGKQVVLYFYPKASTPGCTIEACDFRDLRPKFAKQDIVVLGVSADPVKALVNFKTKQKLNFPLLSDPDHKMIESYGQWRMKKSWAALSKASSAAPSSSTKPATSPKSGTPSA